MSGKKSLAGRPSVMTEDTVRNLENSLRQGFTVSKACEIAGISREAYYSNLEKDQKLTDRMDSAQKFVEEKARQNVANAILDGDTTTSKWYLERKVKGEFSTRQEQVGRDGEPLFDDGQELREIANDLKEALQKNEPTQINSEKVS